MKTLLGLTATVAAGVLPFATGTAQAASLPCGLGTETLTCATKNKASAHLEAK